MRKSITIRYSLCELAKESRPSTDYGGWQADIRSAFANLGWVVTYHGGGSSTHPEDDFIFLKSEDQELDSDVIEELLTQFEIPFADFSGDGVDHEAE